MEARTRYTAITPDLVLLTGFEGEKLDDIGIDIGACTLTLQRLHLNAFADKHQAMHHLAPVLDAVIHRGTVGSVLANRIYPPTTPQELEALTHG